MCPAQDFVIESLEGPTSLKWPERVWYWSLDACGVEELSEERATELGFPTIELSIGIWTRSWDGFAYAGLREFHKGKGFDPESQDVAVQLNAPLFASVSDESQDVAVKLNAFMFELVSSFTRRDEATEDIPDDSESGSDSNWEGSSTGREGDYMTDFMDSNPCEALSTLDTHRKFTSFNEIGEFTGQPSTSASFIPLIDCSTWPTFYQPAVDARLETSSSQNVSAWVESLPTTAWNNQNWASALFEPAIPQFPAWYSNGPVRTLPFNSIDDTGSERPCNSRKRRAEDNKCEYQFASSAKRARLIEY
ncbi:hypothetical protein R3P38DRAFT_3234080 [Favolaschia claudopus]|uniref:Uncharacterized protein n=1 Tax=Favolaschia claudopus TaxID=2862362 RepID=A0AAV9ZGU7_9AGAR